jgi:hypothetical protein
VAILTAIAVPGFRKATEDFRLNATLEDTLDILKSCRAYYLIFNEFPPDAGPLPNRLDLFIPTRLMNPSKNLFICRPLGKTAYAYDVDNWMGNSSYKPHSIGVSLYRIGLNATDQEKYYRKVRSIMEERYVIKNNIDARMICLLPECPSSNIDFNSNTLWDNRYY